MGLRERIIDIGKKYMFTVLLTKCELILCFKSITFELVKVLTQPKIFFFATMYTVLKNAEFYADSKLIYKGIENCPEKLYNF
jgi:hypothetical protein